MNIKTGLSIYNKPWLIEPSVALEMLDFWEGVKSGSVTWDYQKAKGETTDISSYKLRQKFFSSSSVIMAPDNSYDMRDFSGFDGAEIAVIPVSGPLMKSDFCGSFGTQTLRQLTQLASSTQSVKTILFAIDSPGGTVDGTQVFADTIKSSPKQTIAFVDGMMGSAAYWVGCSCDKVYASCETDKIGCIGTMVSLYDKRKSLEAKGIVLREYYATDSKDKNKTFIDAESGDGKALIEEMLDPVNDVFLNVVRSNRGKGLDESALSGKLYVGNAAKDVGLIDGVKSFEQIIQGSKTNSNSIYHNKSKKMANTAAEFKAENPVAYAEIYNAGVTEGATQGANAEKDRVKSWMAWKDIDAEAAAKGIADGAIVTPGVISEMSVKAVNKASIKAAEGENPPTLAVAEVAKTDKEKADKEVEAFTAIVLAEMGIKK